MGTCIESVATAYRRGRLFGRGALHLSDAAARTCLVRAHHEASELDLLINTGLYKDRNVAEPALASLIQRNIGANVGKHVGAIVGRSHDHRHGTFSFDVLNGGCGVLTAAQLVDGFVGGGAARFGLIVAGDADPAPRTSRRFPFAPAGGALLLAYAPEDRGFTRFELRTFSEDTALFEVRMRWDPHAGLAHRGRNVLEVDEDPLFASRCLAHATDVATGFLASAGLRVDDVDLLIASQYPRTFAIDVARRLGLPLDRVPRVRPELVAAHTAGPIAALEASIKSGQFARARHTLFLTAGAGITIAAALYRSSPASAPS